MKRCDQRELDLGKVHSVDVALIGCRQLKAVDSDRSSGEDWSGESIQ